MPEIQCRDISSIQDLLACVADDTKAWTRDGFAKPWFRGVTDARCHKLLPSILRDGNERHEFDLTRKFRLMAPGFGPTPDRDHLDQWLFLMQHHRAPTRLLDWTESPLVAAFFATENAAKKSAVDQDAAVYALDPMALNRESDVIEKGKAIFPNTWVQSSVLQTIKFAFGTQDELVNGKPISYLELPAAIYPSTVHARVTSQRSCFTLHGNDKRDFEAIFRGKSLITEKHLIKYRIPREKVDKVFSELSELGITYASLYPDLDGLARELKHSFRIRG